MAKKKRQAARKTTPTAPATSTPAASVSPGEATKTGETPHPMAGKSSLEPVTHADLIAYGLVKALPDSSESKPGA